MALIAKYDSVYRKKGSGRPVCRYVVSGTAAEMKAYKKAQGEYFIEDSAKGVLWFSTDFHGKSVGLIITENGNITADNEEQLLQQMQVEQRGGNLGEALATELAKQLIGGNASSSSTPAVAPANTGDIGSL